MSDCPICAGGNVAKKMIYLPLIGESTRSFVRLSEAAFMSLKEFAEFTHRLNRIQRRQREFRVNKSLRPWRNR